MQKVMEAIAEVMPFIMEVIMEVMPFIMGVIIGVMERSFIAIQRMPDVIVPGLGTNTDVTSV